jgi:hypothetical protein
MSDTHSRVCFQILGSAPTSYVIYGLDQSDAPFTLRDHQGFLWELELTVSGTYGQILNIRYFRCKTAGPILPTLDETMEQVITNYTPGINLEQYDPIMFTQATNDLYPYEIGGLSGVSYQSFKKLPFLNLNYEILLAGNSIYDALHTAIGDACTYVYTGTLVREYRVYSIHSHESDGSDPYYASINNPATKIFKESDFSLTPGTRYMIYWTWTMPNPMVSTYPFYSKAVFLPLLMRTDDGVEWFYFQEVTVPAQGLLFYSSCTDIPFYDVDEWITAGTDPFSLSIIQHRVENFFTTKKLIIGEDSPSLEIIKSKPNRKNSWRE